MKPKKPKPGESKLRANAPAKELQKVTPLLRIDFANWPPPELDAAARARLAARIAEDLRCTLESAPIRETRAQDDACEETARSALRSSGGEGGGGGGGGGDDIDLVECSLIGSGYDIVEIDGVPRYCRIDYYRCADGKTYRRIFPL